MDDFFKILNDVDELIASIQYKLIYIDGIPSPIAFIRNDLVGYELYYKCNDKVNRHNTDYDNSILIVGYIIHLVLNKKAHISIERLQKKVNPINN